MKKMLLESWQIIALCVPRGTRAKMGQSVSKSAERVNFWQRRPKPQPSLEVDEDGRVRMEERPILNPIDVVDRIQDHAFLHAPDQAHLIDEHFTRRRKEHFAKLGIKSPDESGAPKYAARKKYVELVEALLSRFPAAEIREKWEGTKQFISRSGDDPELEDALKEIEAWLSHMENQGIMPVKRVK